MRPVTIACLIFAASVPVVPQTIRVTVDLVQVDAVVTDANGHHVTDLKAADFRILEDGKPQAITHFESVRADALTKAVNAGRSSESKVAQAVAGGSKALRPEQVRRTIVLMADDLGLSSGDIARVRKTLAGFIDNQMQPGDLVSIMTTSGGMGALSQFSSDKRLLHAAVDRVRFLRGRNGVTWYEPVHQNQPEGPGTATDAMLQNVAAMTRDVYAQGSAAALRYAIAGLRELPGRKAIAVISDGGIDNPLSLVEAANRASVVLYTFDARGLETFNLSAVDSVYAGKTALNLNSLEAGRKRAFYVARQSMEVLAGGTGGTFFRDNNDLGQGLGAALEDMGSYYLIGYQPHREAFERVQGKLPYHRIEVQVLRAGLHVRSRQGFVGVTDDPAPTPNGSAAEQLRRALSSPFAASGVPVQLSASFSAGGVAGDGVIWRGSAKAAHVPLHLRAMMLIDARGLTFDDMPDGKKKLRVDALAAAYGVDNEPVGMDDKTFLGEFSVEEVEGIRESGLVYSLEIPIPRPGPWQLRVAVRDRNSGLMGSAAAFTEVPDFNGNRFALTSILLYDADAARGTALMKAGFPGAGSAVTRLFAQGAVLTWECSILGGAMNRPLAKPEITVEIRLYRGIERIFSGQPIAIVVPPGGDASIQASGTIRLPALLPSGSYSLELVASDRSRGAKLRQAAEWTDFTLAAQ